MLSMLFLYILIHCSQYFSEWNEIEANKQLIQETLHWLAAVVEISKEKCWINHKKCSHFSLASFSSSFFSICLSYFLIAQFERTGSHKDAISPIKIQWQKEQWTQACALTRSFNRRAARNAIGGYELYRFRKNPRYYYMHSLTFLQLFVFSCR